MLQYRTVNLVHWILKSPLSDTYDYLLRLLVYPTSFQTFEIHLIPVYPLHWLQDHESHKTMADSQIQMTRTLLQEN
ncbi:hypothetical protein D3C86_1975970 [compost metagenome]